MIYNFRDRSAGGGAHRGFISMNFGGGGEGVTPDPGTGVNSGIGGDELTIETGLTRGVGLSPTVGLSKRTS